MFGHALLLVTLFGCGRDAVEGRPLERVPTAIASSSSSTSVKASDAGPEPRPPSPSRPDSAKLDVDLEGTRLPLAVTFSRTGHLLFATRRGLWDWDPSGTDQTKQLASIPESLFGAQVRLDKADSSDHLSVFPQRGTTAEDWQLRATFSEDGAFAAIYAENEAFARSNGFAREQVAVSVHRTDSGERVGNWKKTLSIDSSPQYAFLPHLSPSGRFVVIEKALQLEVFEAATGRSVLRRSGGSFDDVSSFLSDTTLLRSHDRALDLFDLATGKLQRSRRSPKGHAVSKDRGRVAWLEKGSLYVWTVATDTVTPPCKDPRICEFCSVEWVDPTHVRVFETRESTTEVVCGVDGNDAPVVVPHAPSPAFEGEGFRVVEDFAPGAAQPSRVLVYLPKVGKVVSLGGGHMQYAASHGRLLVEGDSLRMVDATGELHELTKSH